jgi:hypothetical protein
MFADVTFILTGTSLVTPPLTYWLKESFRFAPRPTKIYVYGSNKHGVGGIGSLETRTITKPTAVNAFINKSFKKILVSKLITIALTRK